MPDALSKGILKVNSTRFGELEVNRSALIFIASGIIGFPKSQRFLLLDYNPPFSWLQSADQAELAFVVVNGAEFGDNYKFDLPIGDKDLDIQPDDECAVLNLVSARPVLEETTVNLKAPIIVNLRTRRGRQIILDDSNFPIRFQLWTKATSETGSNPVPSQPTPKEK
ncbi:MAG: flagellar assembly protein FliW [Deltaproteobacteria bacterium]|nr:flagellar assembly protein FliW [Deltaproteobacteria bacterium]